MAKRILVVAILAGLGLLVDVVGAASVILNEYNAVRDDRLLHNGGADEAFGRVAGNGWDWFELVVVEDHVDMRNWTFVWANDDIPDGTGTIYLSNDAAWADMRQGTIITITERSYSVPSLYTGTDMSIDYLGDWTVNVCTEEEQAKYNGGQDWLARTSDTDLTGHFKTDNDNWGLTIRDGSSSIVFGLAGEQASADYSVSSIDVFILVDDPTNAIDPVAGTWQHNAISTWGAPNHWVGAASEGVQSFNTLRAWSPISTCAAAMVRGYAQTGDLDGDCQVNLVDFTELSGDWMRCIEPGVAGCQEPWN